MERLSLSACCGNWKMVSGNTVAESATHTGRLGRELGEAVDRQVIACSPSLREPGENPIAQLEAAASCVTFLRRTELNGRRRRRNARARVFDALENGTFMKGALRAHWFGRLSVTGRAEYKSCHLFVKAPHCEEDEHSTTVADPGMSFQTDTKKD